MNIAAFWGWVGVAAFVVIFVLAAVAMFLGMIWQMVSFCEWLHGFALRRMEAEYRKGAADRAKSQR